MRLVLLCAALSGAALLTAAPSRAQAPPPGPWPGAPPPPPPLAAPPLAAPPSPFPPSPLPPPLLPPFVEPPPATWGLHAGDTMPVRETMIYGEVGWPDLSLGFQRGVNDVLDVGMRFSMLYGVEYTTPRDRNGVNDTSFGFGVTVPIRFTVHRGARVSFMLHAAPGLRFDYLDAEPRNAKPFAALQITLGAELGVHLSPKNTLAFGVDVPLAVQVTPDPTLFVPFLVGLTFERRFTDRFGMSFNLRPGIVHGRNRTGGATDLALISQVGFLGRI